MTFKAPVGFLSPPASCFYGGGHYGGFRGTAGAAPPRPEALPGQAAGGASRGVVGPLLEAKPTALIIANRTADKALALAERFASLGPVSGVGFSELAGKVFDLVINATSASIDGEALPLPSGLFASGSLAYEMMYGRGETPFLRFARSDGASRLADGLGMLVEQAAEAFFVWRGVRPDGAPVMAMLRHA